MECKMNLTYEVYSCLVLNTRLMFKNEGVFLKEFGHLMCYGPNF